MASQSQGIQQLLAAEKKAAELVSAARKRKDEMLYVLFILILHVLVLFHF